ncbi:GTP-binding protein 10 [Homalodisca vitripennis]|nr:GTP-binding protein 10 [Homalodisca vitripennis]
MTAVTTLRPTVGIVSFPDERQISLADLPGLIEGAHVNRGLGHRFLRHVERSQVLLLVVDVRGFQLSHKYPHRTCIETILLLNKEVELYKEFLLNKPAMLLVNKMDTDGAKERYREITHAVRDLSSVLHKYPPEMRPERLFEFVSVQCFSAKEATEFEVKECQNEIRRVLDWVAVETEAQKERELELLKKLQHRQTEYGPTVL